MPKLIYEGSVKNLWELGADKLEFEYTDAYSVFDWGRMPDPLSRKGESLAALGAFFFNKAADPASWRQARLLSSPWLKPFTGATRALIENEVLALESRGLRHHLVERSGPNRLTVERVAAVGPVEHKLGSQTLYHYMGRGWDQPRRLIPLEVVFRFGVPSGSSLLERMSPEYATALGLLSVPVAGAKLDRPVVEFFSKLEDTDRFLTYEQALNYSGLDFPTFTSLYARTLCLAVWLAELFARSGLELWDGKFEWALDSSSGKPELVLVDSIGPDELRLLDPRSGAQISKEFLRQFYRKTAWFEATKQAKKEAAADPQADWKRLTLDRAGPPPKLSEEFRGAADALYPSLALALTGENPGGAGQPLPQMLERIQKCLAN